MTTTTAVYKREQVLEAVQTAIDERVAAAVANGRGFHQEAVSPIHVAKVFGIGLRRFDLERAEWRSRLRRLVQAGALIQAGKGTYARYTTAAEEKRSAAATAAHREALDAAKAAHALCLRDHASPVGGCTTCAERLATRTEPVAWYLGLDEKEMAPLLRAVAGRLAVCRRERDALAHRPAGALDEWELEVQADLAPLEWIHARLAPRVKEGR